MLHMDGEPEPQGRHAGPAELSGQTRNLLQRKRVRGLLNASVDTTDCSAAHLCESQIDESKISWDAQQTPSKKPRRTPEARKAKPPRPPQLTQKQLDDLKGIPIDDLL